MAGVEEIPARDRGEHAALGARLREERDRLGLSLRELARRLDVSPSLVSQIETGKIQPSVRTLYAIVSELGVSLDEVFAPADDEPDGHRLPPTPRIGRRTVVAGPEPYRAGRGARARPALPRSGGRSSSSRACAGSG